jgi:hypothetical protein
MNSLLGDGRRIPTVNIYVWCMVAIHIKTLVRIQPSPKNDKLSDAYYFNALTTQQAFD